MKANSSNPVGQISKGATTLRSVCTLDLDCISDYEYESVFDSLAKTSWSSYAQTKVKSSNTLPKTPSKVDAYGQNYEIFQDELGFTVCRTVEFEPEPKSDEPIEADELFEDEFLDLLEDDENVAEIERYLMDNKVKSNADVKSECGSEDGAEKYNCFMLVPENHAPNKLVS